MEITKLRIILFSTTFKNFLHGLAATITAMIGYQIHKDFFWAIIDFLIYPFAWLKWLICQEVNLTIIKETFSFFFK